MAALKIKTLLVISVFFSGLLAQAEVKTDVELSVICRLRKEVRTLRVEKQNDGKCRTVYTKLGADQDIGAAQSEASCTEILRKVRVNLEAAEWKCREVQESRVSNLIEM